MTTSDVAADFRQIPLGLINEPMVPSRSQMDDTKLDELTTSILQVGLIQPISVVPVGGRYEVLAGHRRTLACKRAGLVAVPCRVYPSQDAFDEAIQFAENYHREDLNPADEAIWFSTLLDSKCGGDTDVLAQRIGMTRAYVEGRLLLFQGDEDVFHALQAGKIQIGVAHQLNRCTDLRQRRAFLDSAITGGATVAVVSGWIQAWKRDQQYQSGASSAAPASEAPYVAPVTNVYVCACCHGTDDVHMMQPIFIHNYCKRAIFDKVMAAYRGESA